MARKEITIGLFGFGCVGYGLWQVLQQSSGIKTKIKRIVVKDLEKPRQVDSKLFSTTPDDILCDDEINVVVELIDDSEAAFEIVTTALSKGKAVVSANKKMIAEHLPELLNLQRIHNAPFLYEAACCASIPIIRNLEEYYDTDLLESIEGIVNGSTNYILTKTAQDNLTYEDALKEAQQAGYAESNPILDTGGFDAKYKLLILIAHAFGVVLHPDEIFNIGIDKLGPMEINYAREKGYKIKLIAYARKNESGEISAFVMPKFVPSNDHLYYVDDVFNGVKTKTFFSDVQFFSGKGAGALSTASAVLSDISALSYDYRYEYKKMKSNNVVSNDRQHEIKVFIRFELDDEAFIKSNFYTIDETFINKKKGYVIGSLLQSKLHEIISKENVNISVIHWSS